MPKQGNTLRKNQSKFERQPRITSQQTYSPGAGKMSILSASSVGWKKRKGISFNF